MDCPGVAGTLEVLASVKALTVCFGIYSTVCRLTARVFAWKTKRKTPGLLGWCQPYLSNPHARYSVLLTWAYFLDCLKRAFPLPLRACLDCSECSSLRHHAFLCLSVS
ncbi:hypothetical protein NCU16867 [Neurospora crassa OR74A]|uniref:Uncharacterized protein n=1 Tax=Neurospora crassa (strain ATCC 24698 / 74-OR23-1A / CBS 708.71 / DSM 1257 / FGSC 987) TaxID=367110 RepID=V5IPD2_NEUCR|nr:hypothetical protein NCU16867 [Neurospora crassa OR74A]ESA43039.1 hypothetical protein NCU16867 [Neurospora crassa OR74A]|eukprot:XP_011394433.1 hypothetical protein NCU16867 [Neurospora crassa OR74A]